MNWDLTDALNWTLILDDEIVFVGYVVLIFGVIQS